MGRCAKCGHRSWDHGSQGCNVWGPERNAYCNCPELCGAEPPVIVPGPGPFVGSIDPVGPTHRPECAMGLDCDCGANHSRDVAEVESEVGSSVTIARVAHMLTSRADECRRLALEASARRDWIVVEARVRDASAFDLAAVAVREWGGL